MTKKIFYITILSAACLSWTGCTKQIDFVPQDKLSGGSFWKTQRDAELALNGCYGYLNGGFNYMYVDGAADNAHCQYPWESTATAVSAGNITAGSVDVGYKSRYTYIRRYNFFLDNISKPTMTDALRKRFVAEVRVLRAFTYYELAHLFGAVPLLTESYTDPETTAAAPTPVAEVVAFCQKELKEAAIDLPASYSGGSPNEIGRITSGAAWAIATRIELEFGKYADAVQSAQQVMTSGTYKLYRKAALSADDTKDDFGKFVDFADDAARQKFYKGMASYEQQFWIANENNPEVILVSQAIQENQSYPSYGSGLRTLLAPGNAGGWSSITPLQALVDAYGRQDGSFFTPPSAQQRATDFNRGGTPSPNYYNEFKNRDTRLYASILFPGTTFNTYSQGYTFGWNGGGNSNSYTGYNFRKFLDPVAMQSGFEFDSPQDFPIIRYAEILLAFAEAKNELSGPDATIYAALDDIRDRAGMPAIDQSVYGTQATLRELIRNERRIELVGEGQRFFDIRRWKIAGQVMKSPYDISNQIVQERTWQDKFYLMPYPQTAMDRNNNLKSAQAAKGY